MRRASSPRIHKVEVLGGDVLSLLRLDAENSEINKMHLLEFVLCLRKGAGIISYTVSKNRYF